MIMQPGSPMDIGKGKRTQNGSGGGGKSTERTGIRVLCVRQVLVKDIGSAPTAERKWRNELCA